MVYLWILQIEFLLQWKSWVPDKTEIKNVLMKPSLWDASEIWEVKGKETIVQQG